MARALDAAEKEARKIVSEWMAEGERWAAIPGASIAMFTVDQQMIDRLAEAFEVKKAPAASYMSAYGLAWARGSLDATFGFNAWVLPWVSPDLRAQVLNRTTERVAEATIAKLRAKSPLN